MNDSSPSPVGRIAHIDYIDSDVPRDGDTISFPSRRTALREELACAHGDGWCVPPAAAGVDALLEEFPEEQRRWIAARLTPQQLQTWMQPIRLSGAAVAIATTYIRCRIRYDPNDEDTQRQDAPIRSEPSWHYREPAASHMAGLTVPREVAELLLEVV